MAPLLLLTLISLLSYGSVFGDDPEKGCGNKPADIVFVLDESGSIWNLDFIKQLDFVQNVISSFDIGFSKTHIGVLTFGDYERIIFQLGWYTDKARLKDEVKAIQQRRGNTNTSTALKRMREDMFSRQYSRPLVPHVAIVITDGNSDNPEETEKEARLCHEAKIQVFAIGVGNKVSQEELQVIASSRDLVFTVNNYTALDPLRQELAWKACEKSTLPPTTTTTTEPPPGKIVDCSGRRTMDHIWSISEQAGVDETNHALNFIQSVTEEMTIGPFHIQVGLTPRFCDEGKWIRLKDHDTKEGFWKDLNKRRLPALTGLRTDRTLEFIRTKGIAAQNGGRQSAVKYGILIVDNQADDWERTRREAELAKNEGVRLIVIGVGQKIREEQLRELTTSEGHYFYAENYVALADLKSQLIKIICKGITEINIELRKFFERYFEE